MGKGEGGVGCSGGGGDGGYVCVSMGKKECCQRPWLWNFSPAKSQLSAKQNDDYTIYY